MNFFYFPYYYFFLHSLILFAVNNCKMFLYFTKVFNIITDVIFIFGECKGSNFMSIDKLSFKNNIEGLNNNSETLSPFYKFKAEYDKFLQNMKKSDFANSPSSLETQLSMLLKLKDLASDENLTDEIENLEKEIESVSSLINSAGDTNTPSVYYLPVLQHSSIPSEPDKQFDFFIDYLNKNNPPVSEHKKSIVKMLVESGFSNNYLLQMLSELNISDDSSLDINYYQNICNLKVNGLKDSSCLKFSKILSFPFDDETKSTINSLILNLHKAGIADDTAVKILNNLMVKSPDTGLYKISNYAVQTICRMKKTLSLTHNNEKNERNNPINTQNVQVFNSGDTVVIFKDDKISYISPIEGRQSICELEKEYDNAISVIEDSILCDFSKKYRNKNGSFDSIFPRTFVALRRMGICYDQLFSLIDLAVDSSGCLDKKLMDVISSFRKSGMLSADIHSVISASSRNDDGSFYEEDIQNAIELTKSLIPGNIISKLIPYLRNNTDFKDSILDISSIFNNQNRLLDLLPFIITKNNEIDENAIDTIFCLYNRLFSSKKNISEMQIRDTMIDILNEAKNPYDDKISDDAAGIISILLDNSNTSADILAVLKLSKTKNNVVDSQLADIIWNLSLNKVNTDVILKVIEKCKKDGDINYSLVNTILSFFESKEPVNKIIDAVIG